MEKISRKSFVLGAAGALGLGLLTGCGGSEAASSSAASSEAAAPQKELTFADTIRWDSEYDVVVPVSYTHLTLPTTPYV